MQENGANNNLTDAFTSHTKLTWAQLDAIVEQALDNPDQDCEDLLDNVRQRLDRYVVPTCSPLAELHHSGYVEGQELDKSEGPFTVDVYFIYFKAASIQHPPRACLMAASWAQII